MQITDKTGVLVEALPYIQKFRNSIMVVKSAALCRILSCLKPSVSAP